MRIAQKYLDRRKVKPKEAHLERALGGKFAGEFYHWNMTEDPEPAKAPTSAPKQRTTFTPEELQDYSSIEPESYAKVFESRTAAGQAEMKAQLLALAKSGASRPTGFLGYALTQYTTPRSTNLTRAQKIQQKEKPYCLTIQNADGRTGWYPFYAHNDMAADYRAKVLLETFGPQFELQARTLLFALRPVPWVEKTASNSKRRLIAALDNELALTAAAAGAPGQIIEPAEAVKPKAADWTPARRQAHGKLIKAGIARKPGRSRRHIQRCLIIT